MPATKLCQHECNWEKEGCCSGNYDDDDDNMMCVCCRIVLNFCYTQTILEPNQKIMIQPGRYVVWRETVFRWHDIYLSSVIRLSCNS